MVVIENFDKRLELGALLDSSLAHGLGYFAWVALNASYKGVSIRLLCATIIMILDNNSFTS
jgi:hypothetical protein